MAFIPSDLIRGLGIRRLLKNAAVMKRDWLLKSAQSNGSGNGMHIGGNSMHVLRTLLEQRYRDIPSLAFSRLVAGQTYFFDETVTRLRSHFSEDRVFCALLYLNRFLLDLPITASVPLHRLEREVYEPRVQVLRQEGIPLEIVQDVVESSN
jgi:hypothetical protein